MLKQKSELLGCLSALNPEKLCIYDIERSAVIAPKSAERFISFVREIRTQ